MKLPHHLMSRPGMEKVEEHQHPLISEEENTDGRPPTYPFVNPKATGTSSPPDKASKILNLELLHQVNQQLSADVHLPHLPQTTPPGAGMTSTQSSATGRTVSFPSCITHPNRSVVQDHHHPRTLKEDLDLNAHRPPTYPNYLSSVVRTTSPPPSEEDPAKLALRRLTLKKLRRKLREELLGIGLGGWEEAKAVVKPYVPCEWHRRNPPSYWRPDLKALGLQVKYLEGCFHGGVSECCDWRSFRVSVLKEELEKEVRQLKAGNGGLGEKQEMKEKGNDEFTDKTGAEMKKDAEEEVTYFTFITDIYFAETSWPEVLAANGLRKPWPVFRKPPVSIERVVGGRVERTYTREEIEAGGIETEEALWWEKNEGRGVVKEDWNAKEDRMAETVGE